MHSFNSSGGVNSPRPVEIHEFRSYAVLGLFEGAFQTEAAINDLTRNGFSRSAVKIVSYVNKSDFAHYSGAVGIGAAFANQDLSTIEPAATSSSFSAELRKLGVGEDEARWYSDRIDLGDHLVALICDDSRRAEDARVVLLRHLDADGEGQGKGAEAFGEDLAGDPRYRGKGFRDIEDELRGFWESRYPATWERNRDRVQGAFNRARSRHVAA